MIDDERSEQRLRESTAVGVGGREERVGSRWRPRFVVGAAESGTERRPTQLHFAGAACMPRTTDEQRVESQVIRCEEQAELQDHRGPANTTPA